MSRDAQTIPPAQALFLATLITPTEGGIGSRVLAKTTGGNVTLFAFDAGQGLEEHTSPFDALVMVLEGALVLTIGGVAVPARWDFISLGCHVSSIPVIARLGSLHVHLWH